MGVLELNLQVFKKKKTIVFNVSQEKDYKKNLKTLSVRKFNRFEIF